MNFITLNELEKIYRSKLYKHIGLYRADGTREIGIKTNAKLFDVTYNSIKDTINNKSTLPGVYIVRFKKSYGSGPVDYYINVGNVDVEKNNLSEVPQIVNNQPINMQSYLSEMLNNPLNKLTAQITTLELTNKDLERQIDELNEYIADLEGKLSEVQLSELPKEPTTMDTAKSFIEQLIGFGAPLLDKHFELKQQQLEIERAKYAGSKPTYQAPEVQKEISLENKVKQWIASKSDNEEVYNNLTAIYYNSSNLQKFAELLNDHSNELYNECKQYVG
jgi:plasmid maintenance system antidote protein VapI